MKFNTQNWSDFFLTKKISFDFFDLLKVCIDSKEIVSEGFFSDKKEDVSRVVFDSSETDDKDGSTPARRVLKGNSSMKGANPIVSLSKGPMKQTIMRKSGTATSKPKKTGVGVKVSKSGIDRA